MTDAKPFRRDLKPQAAGFDKIEISCEPYLKQSGLSGSEWRTRYCTRFYRNGQQVHENFGHTSLNSAVNLLTYTYYEALDNGQGYFAGEGDFCDQEGCAEKATVWLEKTIEGCGRCGGQNVDTFSRPYRGFCEKHSYRGDSRLDDMDERYTRLESKPTKRKFI